MNHEPSLEQTIRTSGVLRCLECGKCTAVCPISRYDGGFSPRVTVGRALVQRSDELLSDDRLWTCINCLQCSQVCPANVDYSTLTTAVRVEARRHGQAALCTHGEAIHVWMRMMTQPELKQSRLDWLEPANALETADGRRPTAVGGSLTPRSERSGGESKNPAGPRSVDSRGPVRSSALSTSTSSDTLYFAGCAPHYDALFAPLGVQGRSVARASVRILNALGIAPVVLADERCCGHDLLWEGDLDRFLQLARLNAAMIRASGVKRIVSSCPECVRALKVDYPAHGIRLNVDVLHISELAVGLKPKIGHPYGTLRSPKSKITYHDPCRLGRHLGVYNAPRQVLTQLGYEIVEMTHTRRNATCCGTNGWTHCGAANKAIQVQRLREAKATGAEMLVTACLKCQIHFQCALLDRQLADEIGIEMIDLATLAARHLE